MKLTALGGNCCAAIEFAISAGADVSNSAAKLRKIIAITLTYADATYRLR
jgi:hypothetical protein